MTKQHFLVSYFSDPFSLCIYVYTHTYIYIYCCSTLSKVRFVYGFASMCIYYIWKLYIMTTLVEGLDLRSKDWFISLKIRYNPLKSFSSTVSQQSILHLKLSRVSSMRAIRCTWLYVLRALLSPFLI